MGVRWGCLISKVFIYCGISGLDKFWLFNISLSLLLNLGLIISFNFIPDGKGLPKDLDVYIPGFLFCSMLVFFCIFGLIFDI